MKTLLQHLENESLLLLYMAGELPPEDRVELELMLARDGGLRDQLEFLRAAHDTSFAALASLDAADSSRAAEPALRRVSRAMEQWQVDRLAHPPQASVIRSKMPVWAWSGVSAVAALLVFCIWWGFRSDVNGRELADTQPTNPSSIDRNYFAGRTPLPGSPFGSSSDGSEHTPASPNPVQIVTVDTSTQHLGELESVVSEDFARE